MSLPPIRGTQHVTMERSWMFCGKSKKEAQINASAENEILTQPSPQTDTRLKTQRKQTDGNDSLLQDKNLDGNTNLSEVTT